MIVAATENSKDTSSVVEGRTKKARKGKLSKLVDVIFPVSMREIRDSYLQEVLIPGIRKQLFDGIVFSASKAFMDGKIPESERSSNIYSNRYKSNINTNTRVNSRLDVLTIEDVDTVRYSDIRDAQAVIERLQDLTDTWDVVSVQDYFEISGIDEVAANPNNNNYGWEGVKFTNCSIIKCSDGSYRIKLPKPTLIK